MYEKSGDGNNLLQVQVTAVILVGHVSLTKFLQSSFSPKCICLAHLTAQQSPQELLQCVWWELAVAVCVTQSMLLVLALLCWQARAYSLPFQPLGACLSPALAVVQLFCSVTGSTASMQGISLNLIYCQLTQTLNYWFVYWGEKRRHIQLSKHSGNYLSSPFFRLYFSQTPLLPPFSPQLPLFSLLVPTFPPSPSLQWGDGQLESRCVGFCPCHSLLALHRSSLLTAPVPQRGSSMACEEVLCSQFASYARGHIFIANMSGKRDGCILSHSCMQSMKVRCLRRVLILKPWM